jgi:hypothetical protein
MHHVAGLFHKVQSVVRLSEAILLAYPHLEYSWEDEHHVKLLISSNVGMCLELRKF